jgi:hypothetical protein
MARTLGASPAAAFSDRANPCTWTARAYGTVGAGVRDMRTYGFLILGLCLIPACSSEASTSAAATQSDFTQNAMPTATLEPAAELRFPGAVDCNSPAFWYHDGATGEASLNMFFSEPHYVGNDLFTVKKAWGADLASLGPAYSVPYKNGPSNGFRWLEAISQDPDGLLYGWYHHEPPGLCPGKSTTKPVIGAVLSRDGGESWEPLGKNDGIVLSDGVPMDCDVENGFFGGGNGDFSVIRTPDSFYFFFTNYSRDFSQQGVSMARLPYGQHGAPVGKVMKWHSGAFSSPGLNGPVTPIFPAAGDAGTDIFWGPSVHFNAYLNAWVMVLNHAKPSSKDAAFFYQEGIYVSYTQNIDDPTSWSTPVKIFDPHDAFTEAEITDGRAWYPEVVGLEREMGSDTYATQRARFFLRGLSRWEIVFHRPGE